MKILVISNVCPEPVISGNSRLITSYCDQLREQGHEIHYLLIERYLLRKSQRIAYKKGKELTAKKWGKNFHLYKYSIWENLRSNFLIIFRKFFCHNFRNIDDLYANGISQKYLQLETLYNFDAVIVNYYYLSKVLNYVKTKKKALLTHDSFSMYPKGHKAIFYLTQENERKALLRAPYTFAVQEEEATFFKTLVPENKVLTTYIKLPFINQPAVYNHNIVYLSGVSQFNKDGLDWFIQTVFPELKLRYNDIKLKIAGNICKMLNDYSKDPCIELVGRVDNPSDFFSKADIAINPTLQGTGLKIKTMESLAYGKVTITTIHSSTGLYNRRFSPIISSDTPSDWIAAISYLWDNKKALLSKKAEIQSYINEMNKYIDQQYNVFLQGK